MALVKGAFFKCVTGGGKNFYLSADMGTLLLSSEEGGDCFLYKAVERATDCFVTGLRPLVFDFSQGWNEQGWKEFLAALDGRNGNKIDKIELWGNPIDNIWNSSQKGSVIHDFIAIIPYEVENENRTSVLGESCFYYDILLNKKFEVKEVEYTINKEKACSFRAILVGVDNNQEKVILLTNISDHKASNTEIIEIVSRNKPFLLNLTATNNNDKPLSHDLMEDVIEMNTLPHETITLATILEHVFKCFEKIVIGYLFPASYGDVAIQDLFNAQARVRYQKDYVYVRYEINSTASYYQALKRATDVGNACCLHDYRGRRICFAIVEPSAK